MDHFSEWKRSVDETAKDHRRFTDELISRLATLEANQQHSMEQLSDIKRILEKH